MDVLTCRSYAKINLALDVLDRRPEDGYHYVKMITLPIDLADEVRLEKAADLTVYCSPQVTDTPEENLAYRAAKRLQAVTGYPGGAAISIEKKIPTAGGLGGGSSNAAAVLVGLNQLWGTGLTEADLLQVAIEIGSDVPFFILGRPALVEGIGEKLTPVPVRQALWIVLATPDIPKSTGNVYRMFDELSEVRRPQVAAMEAALMSGDPATVSSVLGNVFEDVMVPRYPEIAALKEAMLQAGALGALMSGAGPTVFGIVEDQDKGQRVMQELEPTLRMVRLAKTIGH